MNNFTTSPLIDFDAENELRSSLIHDEKLLWTGRPKKGIAFRSSDLFMVPFSFVWFGGVLTMATQSFSFDGGFFTIWIGLFILVGFYMSIGRFFLDAWKRSKTIYGITAQRVIIKSGIFSAEVSSLNIKVLEHISFREKSDHSGTIMLGNTEFRHSFMQGVEWPGVKQTPRLEFIPDVQRIYHQIVQLQQ